MNRVVTGRYARAGLRWGGALLVAAVVVGLGRGWVQQQYQQAFVAGETASLQAATALGGSVEQELRRRMVANDRADMPALLAGAQAAPMQRVVVVGPNNHIYLDSAADNQGVTLTKTGPHCVECHGTTPTPTAAWLSFAPNVIRVATPIRNDTTCSSCHASSNPYLGVVLVDVSLAEAAATAARSQRGGWTLLVIGAVLAAGLTWLALGLIPALRSPRLPPASRQPFAARARRVLRWGWLAAGVGGLVLLASGGVTLAQVEAQDAFCAACHTQPETDFYARTQAPAVDLASAHPADQVACIDCHSGVGPLGRLSAEAEGATNVLKFVAGQYQRPGALRQPLADANCLKCHADIASANTRANHFHFYLAGWQQAQPGAAGGCVSCHTAHATAGVASDHFVAPAVTRPVCEQCHAAAAP